MGRKSNMNRRKKQKLAKRAKRAAQEKYKHMTNQTVAVYKACDKRHIPEAVATLLDSFCDHHNYWKVFHYRLMVLEIIEDGYRQWTFDKRAQTNPLALALRQRSNGDSAEFIFKLDIWSYVYRLICNRYEWEQFLGYFKDEDKFKQRVRGVWLEKLSEYGDV